MIYKIDRINRTVALDDNLASKYREYDEIHDQMFAIAIRIRYGHVPTASEASDDELSKLCNDVLLTELKAMALLPKAVQVVEDNYDFYKKQSSNGVLVDLKMQEE